MSERGSILLGAMALADVLTDEDMEYIFKEVMGDAGGHGDFLKSFSMAFVRADVENRIFLRPSALAVIVRYDLTRHLPDGGEAVRLRVKQIIESYPNHD